MSAFWQRIAIAVAMIIVASLIAKVIDLRMSRKQLHAGAMTRYRVLRRTVFASVVFVGVMSALLVIPQVRAVAGGVLASSAVVGLVIGFASQNVIGNAVAGILIALSQPLRIGDEVEVEGTQGVVEEIGLTYTWIRTRDNDRLVVPNQKLASNSIRNSTIRATETLAEISVVVPGSADLGAVLASFREAGDEAFLTDIGDKATFTVRKWIPGEGQAEAAKSDLRLAVAEQLKKQGILGL
ncbi:MAG TPA: mechanosensitive ion channel domain-containing protein [Gaiellaceae bacterium]|nr:mechanosensitive ion channel domain-containing protein [Gaiellaceae bacterium]